MTSESRQRVARNFIKRYGKAQFKSLIKAFKELQSGQKVAERLGVSRERVRQWRNTFGETITVYRPYPEAEDLLTAQ